MVDFVLDTSAILTILNREEGLDILLTLLEQAKDHEQVLYIPFIALMEL